MSAENQIDDDEIDLKELWQTLVKGKWVILSSIIIALLLAGLYLFLTKEEFKAEVYLLPPNKADIAELNQPKVKISTKQVYQNLLSRLQSRDLKKRFFDSQNLLTLFEGKKKDTYSIFNDNFTNKIVIKKNIEKGSNDYLSPIEVSLQLPTTKEHVAELTNLYVKTALNQTKEDLIEGVHAGTTNTIKQLKAQIANKRANAHLRKSDAAAKLSEALTVAKALNLQEPIDVNTSGKALQGVLQGNGTPLYYRGTNALKKEIGILKNRKTEDPFIKGLRDLQEQLSYNQSLKINPSLIKVAKIDSWAYPPVKPAKPKKLLVLLLSLILGGVLGTLLVFFKTSPQSKL